MVFFNNIIATDKVKGQYNTNLILQNPFVFTDFHKKFTFS